MVGGGRDVKAFKSLYPGAEGSREYPKLAAVLGLAVPSKVRFFVVGKRSVPRGVRFSVSGSAPLFRCSERDGRSASLACFRCLSISCEGRGIARETPPVVSSMFRCNQKSRGGVFALQPWAQGKLFPIIGTGRCASVLTFSPCHISSSQMTKGAPLLGGSWNVST